MRSAILITSNSKMLCELYQQWERKSSNISLIEEYNRLSMVVNNESIYVDQLDEKGVGYENNELDVIGIQSPYFYAICYSDRDVMQYFLKNSLFNDDSYFDNDEGDIVPVSKLKNIDILTFIQ